MTTEQIAAATRLAEEMGPLITSLDDPNIELLHPALRKSVVDMDGVIWVKHPWVNVFSPFVNHCNKIFSWKFEMMRRYLSERNFEGYLWVAIERPWRYDWVAAMYDRGKIKHHELRELLPGLWMDVEFPSQNLADPAYLWNEAGFVTDDEEQWRQLPDPLTIYRGGSPSGIAWTLSKSTAYFFAQRFETLHKNPQMWRAVVDKDDVLGYVTRRGEQEIVIEPYSFELEKIPVSKDEDDADV